MALSANQIVDARILSSMNGRVELSHFSRITNQSIVSQVNSAQDDNRKNRKYPCPLCGKRFRFNSILSLHMRTHTGEKPFKCPYCDHRAAQKGNLKIHLRTHKQGISGKGRGRIREENRSLHELEERAILRDRQMRASNVSQQQMPASNTNQLQKAFLQTVPTESQFSDISSAADLPPHPSASPKVIPDESIQPQSSGFRCSFCKGKFRKQQESERHIRILHKPYKCTSCEFAAAQEEELIGHVEMTHITADSGPGQKSSVGASDKGKPSGEFPCEVCGQTFSQAWFLKGHMRKHKDSFEHCCQICGRRFKEPWFLKNHMKVHLNKSAAKSNILSDHDSSVTMSNSTQDHPSNIYSQYISRIHNRFQAPDRADLPDYNHMMATAGTDMKVREVLGRMISSGPGPSTDAESSLLALNHLHPQSSSTSMEYSQKVISNRDALNNSGSYATWQIMPPGPSIDQQMFRSKDQQQQCSTYLPERGVPVDDGKLCLSDPDTKAISRPGSPGSVGHHGTGEMITEAGNSTSNHQPESSSTPTGDNVYRCPISSDYTTAETASLSFSSDRYHFPHWQKSRDLSSPFQPSSSNSSSPNTKHGPRSREDWSPAAGQYLGSESHSEEILLAKKQSNPNDKATEASVSDKTRKSQYEPLDLSVRPESIPSQAAMSSAASIQMSGLFSNGLSSAISRRLQSYPNAAAVLSMKPAYQCDLLVQGTKEDMNSHSAASIGHDVEAAFEKFEREDKNEDPAKWKMLRNDAPEPKESGSASDDFEGPCGKNQTQLGQWGRAVADTPISSFESLTPGCADSLSHQGASLSFLRSQGTLNNPPVGAHKASVNGGENAEKETAVRKPFQCRYCPYSASQKGNSKTHVLCVHRKPFDNSLYPDRRLRRSHTPQAPSRLSSGVTRDARASGRDQISVTSSCGT